MTKQDVFNSSKTKKNRKSKPLSFITIHTEQDYLWLRRNMTNCEIWKCSYWSDNEDIAARNRYIIVTVDEVPNKAFGMLRKSGIKSFTVQLGESVEND